MKVKIGMIQSLVEFDQPERNLVSARELVAEAVKEGAQICVLPECGDLGWGNDRAKELGRPIPGPGSDQLCEMAKEFGIYMAAGLTEVENGHAYNAAILVLDQGEILLKHRKISTLRDVEGAAGQTGCTLWRHLEAALWRAFNGIRHAGNRCQQCGYGGSRPLG